MIRLRAMKRLEIWYSRNSTLHFCGHFLNSQPLLFQILCTLLFKSRPMPLSCPEYTRFHFVYYNYLLRRYLEAKHRSVGVAAEKYFRLMEQLQSIDKVTAIIRTVYEALGPQRLTQVLVEIYGLEEKEQHQPSAN